MSSKVNQYSRSGESFSSDADTEDDKMCRTKTGCLYAKSTQESKSTIHSEARAEDNAEDSDDEEPTHLLSLVTSKKAVNKYANKLVRTRDRDFPTCANNTTSTTLQVAPSELEEGRTKSTEQILSANHRGSTGLTDEQKEEAEEVSEGILLLQEAFRDYSYLIKKLPIEIRIENLSFSVPCTDTSPKITTVYNSSFLYKAVKKVKQVTKRLEGVKQARVSRTEYVLNNISLCLKPGKM